jgi:heme/copper-type cytochrome/quinol oxidase subunit 2
VKDASNVLTFSAGLLAISIATAGAVIYLTYLEHQAPPNEKKSENSTRQLHFAAVVLTGLGLLFALSMAMFYWDNGDAESAGKQIFDAVKTIIPPIITLILGYYFGSKSG